MRKFYRPLLQKSEDIVRHGNSRTLSRFRSFDLEENEGRVLPSKEKWHQQSPAEEPGSGFGFVSTCRKSYGKTLAHLPHPRKPKAHSAQMGFSRGLQTARKPKPKKLEDVEKAFDNASTVEELKTTFKELESLLDTEDPRFAMACLRMGQKFESAGEDPETILPYAERALRNLEKDDKDSLMTAMALHLMGYVHYELNKFSASLRYLNRANKVLEKLENEASDFQIKPIAFAVQILLGDAKTAMGRREEALGNYTKSLELKEEVLGPDHQQVAVSNRQVAEAFVAVLNFKEALPLCLKALDLHRKHLGDNSVEVATDRRLLGVIYSGLGEHEKALEENEAAKRVLRNWGKSKDVILVELDSVTVQISVGNYDAAINTLKGIIQHTDNESELRGTVLLLMAKALCNLDKDEDAKKCCELAANVLKRYEETGSMKIPEAYTELAMLYESMDDFEPAISLYKKALGIYEKFDHDPHSEADAKGRLGWVLLLTGSVQEAIDYLESAAEILKESFGPHHYGVGYIYNNLGAAYEELERPEAAVKMYVMARNVLETALGPQHMDTIDTIQNLANLHSSTGSYGLAIGFQKEVIEALKNHGPSARDALKEARYRLADLERQARQASVKPVKDDMHDQHIVEKPLIDESASDDEIDDGDNFSVKLLSKKSVSKNKNEGAKNASGELPSKKSGSENEIGISGKLSTNLTKENASENEIEDTRSVRERLLTKLTKRTVTK